VDLYQINSTMRPSEDRRLFAILVLLTSILFVLLMMEREQWLENMFTGSRTPEEEIMAEFRRKDVTFVTEVFESEIATLTEIEARSILYRLLAFPLQGVCRMLKRVGGQWLGREVDGDKFICMDRILERGENCIIYTFGINDDWTFEDMMAGQGCRVEAYDHTVDFPEKRGSKITFHQLGLGTEDHMDTLYSILKSNGHIDTLIDYIKIDIECHEITGLPDWISTGALAKVHQIAIEIHMTCGQSYVSLLEVLRDLYRLNFRLISQSVNKVWGYDNGWYRGIEVVFMKDDVWNHLSS